MRCTPDTVEVRELVLRTFDEFQTAQTHREEFSETILIEDGCYLARSYRQDGLLAMWLIQDGVLQFYDAEGNMLRTVNLFEELHPKKMAA